MVGLLTASFKQTHLCSLLMISLMLSNHYEDDSKDDENERAKQKRDAS